ncbi:MAG: hypothetical protein R2706_17310 [Acidimicrobiales bacterium]
MGPGVSSISPAISTPESATTSADAVLEPDAPTGSSALESAPSPTTVVADIDLAGWSAPWPQRWGSPTPYFSGWIRFPGTGSDTFADNITAEVTPQAEGSDDEARQRIEQVLAAALPDLVIESFEVLNNPAGLPVVLVRFRYQIGDETIRGERALVRGPNNDLLLTIAGPDPGFAELQGELAAVVVGAVGP